MNHTTNLHLPQWEETDRIQMDDFNDAMEKLDTAVAAAPRIATGTYTGTGEYGEEHPNTLTFDFEPQLIILDSSHLYVYNNVPCYYVLFRGAAYLGAPGTSGKNMVTWENNQVSWYYVQEWPNDNLPLCQFNVSGRTYHYIAVG